MSFDDLILSCQRALDRLLRRLLKGAPSSVEGRRLLIVQIDGLSRSVLERGLKSGRMPFVRRLLRRGYHLEPMSVGLPTSTPAFQMAAMYGVRPDIPGFHYYDRERQSDIHFPRRGHAALVEAKQAAGRRGILAGGSAYGCVFTGGADNSFFTFATLTRPSGRGVLRALAPFVLIGWVCVKCLARTIVELAKAAPRVLVQRPRGQQGRRWLTIKIGISVWMRGLFTLAVARDIYAGAPAVYVNYVDYDEAAHAFGPRSRPALVTLRRIDGAIRRLWRVAQRVPEYNYDLYILADHGQTPCRPYRDLTSGRRFELWIFEQMLNQPLNAPPRNGWPAETPRQPGLINGMRRQSGSAEGFYQRYLNYVNEDYLRRPDPEAHEQDGVRVISAGPNAFLYVKDAREPLDADALERRFPGVAEKLSASPGVGFVLARSPNGPVCFASGRRYHFGETVPGPFAHRKDARLVVQGIADLMSMPSAGDLVIYGTDAAQGHVSFIPEFGAHAGPSHDEMHTFIVRPPRVKLPAPITHPVQLYEHFIRYQAKP